MSITSCVGQEWEKAEKTLAVGDADKMAWQGYWLGTGLKASVYLLYNAIHLVSRGADREQQPYICLLVTHSSLVNATLIGIRYSSGHEPWIVRSN